jgi:hypothetical protein
VLRTARPIAPLRRGHILLIVVVAAVAAVVVVLSSASAQAPGRTLTFKELDKGSTFVHIRNTKTKSERSNSMGDVIAFTNPLADASGKRIGKLYAHCTTTVGNRSFLKSTITCSVILVLGDGTLTGTANVTPAAAATTGAITGGTGAYAGARGVVVSKPTDTGSDDTVTLID